MKSIWGVKKFSPKPGMIALGVSLLGRRPDIPRESPLVTPRNVFRCAETNNLCSSTPRRNDNR
jgi:hypothetical protein